MNCLQLMLRRYYSICTCLKLVLISKSTNIIFLPLYIPQINFWMYKDMNASRMVIIIFKLKSYSGENTLYSGENMMLKKYQQYLSSGPPPPVPSQGLPISTITKADVDIRTTSALSMSIYKILLHTLYLSVHSLLGYLSKQVLLAPRR